MRDMPKGLGDVDRRMAVIAAADRLLEGHEFFGDGGVHGVLMTVFAVGLGML